MLSTAVTSPRLISRVLSMVWMPCQLSKAMMDMITSTTMTSIKVNPDGGVGGEGPKRPERIKRLRRSMVAVPCSPCSQALSP